jgi:hypothetical protein
MSQSFDQTKAVVDLYINSSDSFIKLALAVLAASVGFPSKWAPGDAPPAALLTGWILLLASVAAGSLYQYLAIHLLDSLSENPGAPGLLARWIPKAGRAYGAMLIAFYLGAVLALVGIYQRLVQ